MYTDPVGPAADGVALASTDLNVCTVSLSLSCKEAEKECKKERKKKERKKEETFYIHSEKKERKGKSKEMLYRINRCDVQEINRCDVQDGSRQFFPKNTILLYTQILYTLFILFLFLWCVCVCVCFVCRVVYYITRKSKSK
jgi:hypothetical protein